MRRGGMAMLAMLALLTALGRSQAADPQPYQVTIAPTGDAALDKALTGASGLVSLRESAPVGPFPLLARARGDGERFLAVLHGMGHYAARVAITVDGQALDDPGLLARLDGLTEATPVVVAIAVTPGPLFHLRHVTLEGEVPAGFEAALGLAPGAPAVAADVLTGGARLLAALRDAGHALARVDPPVATLDPAAETLDVRFPVHAGPRVTLGPIGFAGLDRVHEAYLRRRLALHAGEPFSPAALAAARQDLAATGLFTTVRVEPATALDAAGTLPVRVQLRERKPRSVNLGASFSTDEGGSLNAAWTHRNLFGNAEKLTVSGALTQLGGTANRQPGYTAGVRLALPDWARRDQTLGFHVVAMREYLDAYNRTGVTGGATLTRKLGGGLTISMGTTALVEDIGQEGVHTSYRLAQVPMTLAWDTTDSPLDPTRGLRASASLTPTLSLGNAQTSVFTIAQAAAATYLDFGTKGRSVLALRGLVGAVQGAGVFAMPPDQRFYAGGGGSVRGFRYQSLGKQFASGRPVGGTAVDVGSVEFRQRIGASWGAVGFVDAGQISSDGVPFTGSPHVGAGVGVRYYTGIGPVRLDVAVPLTRERKGDAFELYIGLGQAF
ncbi:MAG: hypothetical protein BGP12_21930 [Rhodospirillales bacterium 70-18]|nr:MAG: hypothetical protein BGP12_21930 [Rhodospirillales bacterium 70-18]